MSSDNPNHLILAIRWLARIASLASIGLLLAFALGPAENLSFQSNSEVVGFLLFPGGIVVGMLIAWRWEIPGGLLTLASLVGFYGWHLARAGDLPSGPYFLLFALPGFMLLLVGFASINDNKSSSGSGVN